MIGTAADNTIWLVTVDGRQPELSVGMTLVELRALAHRLGLVNALNLDGGGSTTMWVQGQVVNKPSDPIGPRKVSDALLVHGVIGERREPRIAWTTREHLDHGLHGFHGQHGNQNHELRGLHGQHWD